MVKSMDDNDILCLCLGPAQASSKGQKSEARIGRHPVKVVPYYPRCTVPSRPTEGCRKGQKSGTSVQRYPRRSITVKNYTEEVPHDDHYICKQCHSVVGTPPPHPRFGGLIGGATNWRNFNNYICSIYRIPKS